MSYMPKSKSDIHVTPDRVWGIILLTWGIAQEKFFDPCPIGFTQDGLGIIWTKLNYVNPPYSLLKEFVAEAIHQADLYGHKTIMLLPSKTDQEWFHKLIEKKYEIVWIRKRLKFKNNKWSATQPHFLVMIK